MKIAYIFNKRGAISVFLLIIFLSLLMLAGLIVDICRVMAAERKVQNALDTAVRSVLADYNQELVGQFGLFAVTSQGQEEELHRYFRVNLEERHQNFNFINVEINNVEIKSVLQHSMLNDDIFKEQILEYMQYKGPLLMTENVLEVFQKGGFAKKAALLNSGKDASRNIKQLEQTKQELNKQLQKIKRYAIGSTVEKIATVENIKKGVAELRELTDETLEKAQAANRQIAEIKAETNQLLLDQEQQALADIQGFEKPEELIILQENLSQLQADLEANQRIYEQIATLEEELLALEYEDFQGQDKIYGQIKNLQGQLLEIELLKQLAVPEQDSLSPEAAQEKNVLLAKLEKITGQKISEDNPVSLLIKPEYFRQANEQKASFLSHNISLGPAEDQMQKMSGKNDYAEEVSSNVFGFLTEINERIEQLVLDGRNKVYLTEYIMDKYTFVTSPVSRGHYFDRGGVEYILCGRNYEYANLIEAAFNVWSIRFALNVVDAFFLSRIPFFPARLAKALTSGFLMSTNDLLTMFGGRGVPLCASLGKLPVNFTYSDHLRLLLLLQNGETQLERMRQLIQISIRQTDPDFELKNYQTLITGQADVTINLWFAQLLQLDKFGFPQIEGGKYHLSRFSTQGY